MPKEKRPLDVEALLMWLIEKVEAHIGGGDRSVVKLASVILASFAGATAVDSSGAPASESNSFTPVLPAFADTTAVDSTGAAASTTESMSPALPAFAFTTQVIP